MVFNSIWFVTGDGRCHRFDLRGNLLEVLQELPSGHIGKRDAPNDHAMWLRRMVPDGLLRADTCERYDEIAVYEGNSSDFTRKDFSFIQRVFQWWSGHFGHGNLQ